MKKEKDTKVKENLLGKKNFVCCRVISVVLYGHFTIFMIGWIVAASLSTTKEIFTGELLSTGLHFENYTNAFFRKKALIKC